MMQHPMGQPTGGAAGPYAADDEGSWPTTGKVLDGKYRLICELAAGSMGSVWQAEHMALEAQVAVKLMLPVGELDTNARWRFLREARVACALRSPHIVQVLDFGVCDETPFIVMELLHGESLAKRLDRRGRLVPRELASVLTQLGRALDRAHSCGVVHRDLKPANVFITDEQDHEVTKLLDFGVAHVGGSRLGAALSSRSEPEFAGTPRYMSPEQLWGSSAPNHQADVWALGILAFECLLGFPPFVCNHLAGLVLQVCSRPLPVPSRHGSVPAGFDDWFQRACARSPEARFASARLAADAFEALCQAAPTSSHEANGSGARSEKPASAPANEPNPRAAGVRAGRCALVLLLAGLAGRAWAGAGNTPPPDAATVAAAASVATVDSASPARPLGLGRHRGGTAAVPVNGTVDAAAPLPVLPPQPLPRAPL